MTERILLSVFFLCLVCCAVLMLAGIWFEHSLPTPISFQAAASFFIVGLASFLTWFVGTLRRIVRMLDATR